MTCPRLRNQYSWFHLVFALGAMYVAGLLTDWAIISTSPVANPIDPIPITPGSRLAAIVRRVMEDGEPDVWIGRSEATMWMRVISSWVCYLIYGWSL